VAVHPVSQYKTRKGGYGQKQVNIDSEFGTTLNTASALAQALFI
jgi:hypothetical protein